MSDWSSHASVHLPSVEVDLVDFPLVEVVGSPLVDLDVD